VIICDGCGVEEPGESVENWVPLSAYTKLTDLALAKRWYVGRENPVKGWILHLCPDCLELHSPTIQRTGPGWTYSCSCSHYGNDLYPEVPDAAEAWERHVRDWLPLRATPLTTTIPAP
jgi:hypothetical protein